MEKQNRREEWRQEWRRLWVRWESKLLMVAWAAALLFVTGMVLGGLLNHRNTPPSPPEDRPVVDVVFTEEAPPPAEVYIAGAFPSLRHSPGGTPVSFEWPCSA